MAGLQICERRTLRQAVRPHVWRWKDGLLPSPERQGTLTVLLQILGAHLLRAPTRLVDAAEWTISAGRGMSGGIEEGQLNGA